MCLIYAPLQTCKNRKKRVDNNEKEWYNNKAVRDGGTKETEKQAAGAEESQVEVVQKSQVLKIANNKVSIT